MFTVGHPLNVEFEPPLSKIEVMGVSCLALGAGNSLFVSEMFNRTTAGYQNAPTLTVAQIANATKDSYVAYRDERVEEQLIRQNLGPEFVAFRNRGGTLPAHLHPQAGIGHRTRDPGSTITLHIARADSLQQSPLWSESFQKRRCIIVELHLTTGRELFEAVFAYLMTGQPL